MHLTSQTISFYPIFLWCSIYVKRTFCKNIKVCWQGYFQPSASLHFYHFLCHHFSELNLFSSKLPVGTLSLLLASFLVHITILTKYSVIVQFATLLSVTVSRGRQGETDPLPARPVQPVSTRKRRAGTLMQSVLFLL